MRIEITGKGIFGAKGEVPVGTVIDVKEEPKGWAGRYRVVSGGSKDGKTVVTNPAKTDEPKVPLSAIDAGSGWWKVIDADGKAFGKKMREADAKAFNEMSDEDKAAYIKEVA